MQHLAARLDCIFDHWKRHPGGLALLLPCRLPRGGAPSQSHPAGFGLGCRTEIGYAAPWRRAFGSILAIMAGAALGGVARAWLCQRVRGAGVLLVNVTGSLALGCIGRACGARTACCGCSGRQAFLGPTRPCPAFALQSVQMWQGGCRGQAVANIAGRLRCRSGRLRLACGGGRHEPVGRPRGRAWRRRARGPVVAVAASRHAYARMPRGRC